MRLTAAVTRALTEASRLLRNFTSPHIVWVISRTQLPLPTGTSKLLVHLMAVRLSLEAVTGICRQGRQMMVSQAMAHGMA